MRNFLNFLTLFSVPSFILISAFLLLALLFFALGTVFIIALPVIFVAFLIFLFSKKKKQIQKPDDVVIDVEVL